MESAAATVTHPANVWLSPPRQSDLPRFCPLAAPPPARCIVKISPRFIQLFCIATRTKAARNILRAGELPRVAERSSAGLDSCGRAASRQPVDRGPMLNAHIPAEEQPSAAPTLQKLRYERCFYLKRYYRSLTDSCNLQCAEIPPPLLSIFGGRARANRRGREMGRPRLRVSLRTGQLRATG